MKLNQLRKTHKKSIIASGGIFIITILIGFILFSHFDQQKMPRSRAEFNKQLPDKYKKKKLRSGTRPSDWGWLQRVFPHGTADKMAHIEAIQQAQKMRAVAKARVQSNTTSGTLSAVQWQFAGPLNIGGRISDIEYNPLDPSIVYAGAATGGVFKSLDGGWTWNAIFDDQAVLSVGDIAVDPLNPDVIYVGTGEANGGHNNFPGGGIYKSTDAGLNWQLVGLERTASIGRIVIDPSNTQRVFVAAVGSYFGPDPDRGVYRSVDGGVTWEKSLFVSDSTGAIDIVINPQNPSMLLAAMWERVRRAHTSHLYGPTSGIFRSTDGGDSWTRLDASSGLPDGEINIGRIGLALCKAQPDFIYALYTDGYDYKACYKSSNGGVSWTQVDPYKRISNGTSGFSWYFGNIRVHPTNPQRVYALDVAFMRSDDGGYNWPLIYGYGNPYRDFHVDHHALAFHPFNPDTLIDGNDGGINISYNGGSSWTKVGLLPVTQFYEITMDQTNPERLYGGTQDNGTLRTLTGKVDDWEEIYGGDGFFVIVDPTNPDIIYAESQFGYLGKSTNGGSYFRYALTGINGSEPTNWSTPVIMDPNNHNVLYYGTDRVYRTINGADSWQAISADLTKQLTNSRLGTVTTIAVAPTNSNVIYAGTDDGNVWVSADYGVQWQNITVGLPFRWVTRIAVDPTDADIAYVTFSGMKWKSPQSHVFRTQNMGQSWEDISSNLPDAPVNIIVVDPLYPNYLYVGSDVGCFYSPNFGASWDVPGQGLPVVPVYSMDLHRTLRRLVVGTHGRSMYTISLETFDTKHITQNFTKGWNLFSINLNPNDPAIEALMNPVVDKLTLVKNNRGQTYIPKYGINDIGDIDFKEGYYAYLIETTSLDITGRSVDAGTPIALPAGWSMISYLPEIPIDIETALAGISAQLVLAKNGAGQTYIPDYGINQIGQMQPGHGYQLYLKAEATLIYPSGAATIPRASKRSSVLQLAPTSHFQPISRTGENALIVIPIDIMPKYSDGSPLQNADQIGVFTPAGLCCGAAVWNGTNTAITIWGDNSQTESPDGFRSGETLFFRIWRKSANVEFSASARVEQDHPIKFQANGFSVLTELAAGTVSQAASSTDEAVMPAKFDLLQNYPNPFNSETTIVYDVKEKTGVTLQIYNEMGQIVRTLVKAEKLPGRYEVKWNGRDQGGLAVSSGIYYCRMGAKHFRGVRRLVYLK